MHLYTYIWNWSDERGCNYNVVLLANSAFDAQRRIAAHIEAINPRRRTPHDDAILAYCTTHDAHEVLTPLKTVYTIWAEPGYGY